MNNTSVCVCACVCVHVCLPGITLVSQLSVWRGESISSVE